MNLDTLAIGSTGVAAAEVVNTIDPPASGDASEIIKIVVQLLIGIATLIGLFKKKKQ